MENKIGQPFIITLSEAKYKKKEYPTRLIGVEISAPEENQEKVFLVSFEISKKDWMDIHYDSVDYDFFPSLVGTNSESLVPFYIADNVDEERPSVFPEDFKYGDMAKITFGIDASNYTAFFGPIDGSGSCVKGEFIAEEGVDEEAQSSSFSNATLHGVTEGIACSIAIHPKYPQSILSQTEVTKYLKDKLGPLCDEGWTIEVQIGPSTDAGNND